MLNKMSLKIKLFFLITLVVVITLIIVSTIVSYRSVSMAKDDAFQLAEEMSEKYSYEIKSELQGARVTSESLKTVFETLINRDAVDRDTLNDILKNSLKQKDYIISFCVAFEPNKLDGKDALYAGQSPLYDETGRYAPYWSMVDGEIGVEALSGFDDEDWYAGAKKSKKEYITDPFFFEVQGESVLMTSLVFPVMIDGEFIGIVSSDMALDSLQDMVSQVNTSGLDEYTEVYSNSGVIVAHPDDDYFNKSIYETSAYNMLTSDSSKLSEAVKIAEEYVDNNPVKDQSDERMIEEYDTSNAFVSDLKEYAENPDESELDLSLITDDMAKELLTLDENRMKVADKATDSVANGEPFTVTEDDYYKVYMPVKFSESTNPWSVTVNVPMSEVLKKSNEIRNYVILVSVIAIIIMAFLLYLISRNLTRPILDLADSAKQIGEGNYDANIPQTRNHDEIGILANAFKVMAERINELVNKLTRNAEELEEKNINLNNLNKMLVEAKDQAEASNKAKTAFLSNMSHEMRTPLNAIMGMTDLGKKAKDDDKKDYSFEKIEEASTHLLAVVNDILDMSKIEADKLELSPREFSFDKLIESVMNIVNFQLKEKKQTMDTHIDSKIPKYFIGDDHRLSQVISNLLSNAVKFTGENGKIGLKAFVADRTDNVYTLQFEVSDTGIGISEEHQKNLFKSFEQADSSTSRNYGGTGLGLAISKSIVELMDGKVWIDSQEGKGSTFSFTVKLEGSDGLKTKDEKPDESDQNDEVQEYDFSNKTILLAEDVEINQEIVTAMLEPTGVDIDCAVNGKEAYEMFVADPEKYDLILMDIQMPEMDGLEATKKIRSLDNQHSREIPVIALTANVFKEDIDNYINGGINDHIGKPLDYNILVEMLEKYLNR